MFFVFDQSSSSERAFQGGIFKLVLEGRDVFGHSEAWTRDYQGSREWREERIGKDIEVGKSESLKKCFYRRICFATRAGRNNIRGLV